MCVQLYICHVSTHVPRYVIQLYAYVQQSNVPMKLHMTCKRHKTKRELIFFPSSFSHPTHVVDSYHHTKSWASDECHFQSEEKNRSTWSMFRHTQHGKGKRIKKTHNNNYNKRRNLTPRHTKLRSATTSLGGHTFYNI